jgi:hypothetical protein
VDSRTWLTCTDPQKMLASLRAGGGMSDRKPRLLACACARNVWDRLRSPACARAVGVAERFADGEVGPNELARAYRSAWKAVQRLARILQQWSSEKRTLEIAPNRVAWAAALADASLAAHNALNLHAVLDQPSRIRPWQCSLLREIFGNPFAARPVLDPAWLAWREGVVARLARAAYEERDPERGTLDSARLAVLADALEEAGCADAELLGHLRGPGPHVPGCWAVDCLLGR